MARIRSIKPDFFTSEKIAELSLSARLTFIGLWTHADDNGVMVDNPRLIMAAIWPLEDDPLETLQRTREDLQSLSDAGLIVRYKAGNRSLLFITGWDEHQKVSHPAKPRYPRPTPEQIEQALAAASRMSSEDAPFTDPSGDSPETLANAPEDLFSSQEILGPEQGAGSREQGNTSSPPAAAKARISRAQSDAAFATFWKVYPRKVGKAAARKVWDKLIKDGVDPLDIISGAQNYLRDPIRQSSDIKFTAHPATWLNQGRWTDEVPVTTTSSVGNFWEN